MELKPCCQFVLFLELEVSDWVRHVFNLHGDEELEAIYAAYGGADAVKEAFLAAKEAEAGVDAGKEEEDADEKPFDVAKEASEHAGEEEEEEAAAGKKKEAAAEVTGKEAGVDDLKAGKEAGKKTDAAAEETGEDASKEEEVAEREDAGEEEEEEEVLTGHHGFWTADQDDAAEEEVRKNIFRMREEEKWEREEQRVRDELWAQLEAGKTITEIREAKIAKKAKIDLTAEQEVEKAKWEAERARWKAKSDAEDKKKAMEEVADRAKSAARFDATLAQLRKDAKVKERAKARAAARGEEYSDSSEEDQAEDSEAYSGAPNDSDSGSGNGDAGASSGGTYLVHDFED